MPLDGRGVFNERRVASNGRSAGLPERCGHGQVRFVAQSSRVRRIVATLLVAFIALLPAVDSLACPDGCSNPMRVQTRLDRDGAAVPAAACGLCLNASFVHRNPGLALRCERILTVIAERPIAIVSVAPRQIERPPRPA